MHKPIKFIALILMGALIFTMGCSAAQKPVPDYVVPDDKNAGTNNPGGNNFAADSNPAEVSRESEALRRQVMSVNGVGDATVVINNSRAIVGVMPSRDYNGDEAKLVSNVQSSIADHSGNLREVYVTAETLLFRQIRGIENKINSGQDPERYANELNDISETIRTNNGDGKGMEQRS